MSELLCNVQKNQSLLITIDNREIVSFAVSLIQPMGLKRSVGKRSFIDSVLDTLEDFYENIVQYLRVWQPPAPKMQRGEAEEIDTRPASSTGGDSTEPIDNAIAETEAVSSDSSNAKLEPNQKLETTGNNAAASHSLDKPASPEHQP